MAEHLAPAARRPRTAQSPARAAPGSRVANERHRRGRARAGRAAARASPAGRGAGGGRRRPATSADADHQRRELERPPVPMQRRSTQAANSSGTSDGEPRLEPASQRVRHACTLRRNPRAAYFMPTSVSAAGNAHCAGRPASASVRAPSVSAGTVESGVEHDPAPRRSRGRARRRAAQQRVVREPAQETGRADDLARPVHRRPRRGNVPRARRSIGSSQSLPGGYDGAESARSSAARSRGVEAWKPARPRCVKSGARHVQRPALGLPAPDRDDRRPRRRARSATPSRPPSPRRRRRPRPRTRAARTRARRVGRPPARAARRARVAGRDAARVGRARRRRARTRRRPRESARRAAAGSSRPSRCRARSSLDVLEELARRSGGSGRAPSATSGASAPAPQPPPHREARERGRGRQWPSLSERIRRCRIAAARCRHAAAGIRSVAEHGDLAGLDAAVAQRRVRDEARRARRRRSRTARSRLT